MPLCVEAHWRENAEDGIVEGRGSRWSKQDVIRVDPAVVSVQLEAMQQKTLGRPIQPSMQVEILLRCIIEEMLSAAALTESSVAAQFATGQERCSQHQSLL